LCAYATGQTVISVICVLIRDIGISLGGMQWRHRLLKIFDMYFPSGTLMIEDVLWLLPFLCGRMRVEDNRSWERVGLESLFAHLTGCLNVVTYNSIN